MAEMPAVSAQKPVPAGAAGPQSFVPIEASAPHMPGPAAIDNVTITSAGAGHGPNGAPMGGFDVGPPGNGGGFFSARQNEGPPAERTVAPSPSGTYGPGLTGWGED